MSERIPHRLILHIGLHKTGTTSFQEACFTAREALRQAGIHYPEAQLLTAGTAQHVLLAPMLRTPDGSAALMAFLRDLGAHHEPGCILLSAEELSTFFTASPDREHAQVFIESLDRHFEDWQAYAVVREGPDMLRSLLMQGLESVGYPHSLAEAAIASRKYQHIQCQALKRVLGDRVTAIDYAEIPKAEFCRSLLHRLTGADIALKEARKNVSSEKPFLWLLSADMRRLWADVLSARHPYSADVSREVARTINSLQMDPAQEKRLRETLARAMDDAIERAMNETYPTQHLIDYFKNPD